jgi:hypothetical protein
MTTAPEIRRSCSGARIPLHRAPAASISPLFLSGLAVDQNVGKSNANPPAGQVQQVAQFSEPAWGNRSRLLLAEAGR